MNPKGLLAAASMTSQTSSPRRSHIRAISFTRPMFTLRKVFSRSLIISADWVEETGMTVSTAFP